MTDLFDLGENICSAKVREDDYNTRMYKEAVKDLESSKGKIEITWKQGEVVVGWTDSEETFTLNTFYFISTRPKFSSKGGRHTGDYSWTWSLFNLLDAPESINRVCFQKDRNELLSRYFGYSPKSVARQLQACMLKAFIPEDLKGVAQKYCRKSNSRRNWDDLKVDVLYKRQDLVRQCLRDDMENVIPLILGSGVESVTELKGKVGKGCWKRLVKNSCTRNKHLAENVKENFEPFVVNNLNSLPSSLLRSLLSRKDSWEGGINYSKYTVDLLKRMRILTKREHHREINNIVSDTVRMVNDLGRKLPKNCREWNFPKWEEVHDKCVKDIRKKQYSDKPLDWLRKLPKEFKDDKFTATLLDNKLAIILEGDKMHHCVGGYATSVEQANYLVIHISGEEDSTLGLYVDYENRGLSFSQHYTYCNQKVSEDSKEFGKKVMKFYQEKIKNI